MTGRWGKGGGGGGKQEEKNNLEILLTSPGVASSPFSLLLLHALKSSVFVLVNISYSQTFHLLPLVSPRPLLVTDLLPFSLFY